MRTPYLDALRRVLVITSYEKYFPLEKERTRFSISDTIII